MIVSRWLSNVILISILPFCAGCMHGKHSIAVVPRTTGTLFWEPFHLGVDAVALNNRVDYFWNAPEDDLDAEKQLDMFEALQKQDYDGYILAPDMIRSFSTSIQNVIHNRKPIVLVNEMSGPSAGTYVSYVLNDDEYGGRLAANRVIELLRGKGNIAIVGTYAVSLRPRPYFSASREAV